MTINSFLLLTIFPALLPPPKYENEEDEFEYYNVLGFTECSLKIDITDIRKAYRKKSLLLHPDKIAQRGITSDADRKKAQKLYEQVQEAYNCLNDDNTATTSNDNNDTKTNATISNSRLMYHNYGCSVRRYRFVSGPSPELYNPMALGENLTKASVALKTRIILAVACILFLLLLQPILIATKINDNRLEKTSWMVTLIPWYLFHIAAILIVGTLVVLSKFDMHITCKWIEIILWLVGIMLLAHQWDVNNDDKAETLTTTNWHRIAIPFYCAIMVRIVSSILFIRTIKSMQSKMISKEFLAKKENINLDDWMEEEDNDNNSNDNNEDDERQQQKRSILKKYIIITVDESTDEMARQLSREAMLSREVPPPEGGENHNIEEEIAEAIRVQSSAEHRSLERQKQKLYQSISYTMVTGITFILLVSYKLTNDSKLYNTSWWIIFLPILLSICIPLLLTCCICCCINPAKSRDEDDIVMMARSNNDASATGATEEAKQDNDEELGHATKNSTTPPITPPTTIYDDGIRITASSDHGNSDKKQQDRGIILDDNDGIRVTPSGDSEDPLFLPPEDEPQQPAKNDDNNTTPLTDGVKVDGTDDVPNQEKKDDDDDDDSIDDEMLRAKSSACGGCCWYLFQLIILCLIIGKLEAEYDNDDDSDDEEDDGYNAFWVLFPFFLITGIILFCCSCLIYSAKGDEIDRLKHQHHHQQQNPDATDESGKNETNVPNNNNDATNLNENNGGNIIDTAAGTTTTPAAMHDPLGTDTMDAETMSVPEQVSSLPSSERTDPKLNREKDDDDKMEHVKSGITNQIVNDDVETGDGSGDGGGSNRIDDID